MDAARFEQLRACLPPLPIDAATDHFDFAANSQYQTDSSIPPTDVWKANGRADRAYRSQPPLRWRMYEVKARRDLKMDLIWHPDFPKHRIARLRFVSASKSAAARTRHTKRREIQARDNAGVEACAEIAFDVVALEDLWGHVGSPIPCPNIEF